MSKPQEIDDKFAQIVLALEEALFELQDLLDEDYNFSQKEKEDLMTAKELVQSARDITVCVIASKNGKKPPPQF